MRKFYSTRGRWPMALAAVAGSVMLAAPPALAATGAHTGVTTFTKSGACPTPPPGSSNFGDELALSYEGRGELVLPAAVPVVVVFKTVPWWQGPPGTYAAGGCSGTGSAPIVSGATITDARQGTALDPNPTLVDQCTFTGGSYTRNASIPTPETAVFTGGTCTSGSSLAGVVGATVTNTGTSVCVPGIPPQTFPSACETTYMVS